MSNVIVMDPSVPRKSESNEDPRRRFPIDVQLPALPTMAAIAWRAIDAYNHPPTLFALGTTPVRIVGGKEEPVSAQALTVDSMSHASARSAWWYKMSEKKGEIEQFPLERVMKDMLAHPNPPLPPLTRITQAPMFGEDGSLSVQPGYNPRTGHYYVANGLQTRLPNASPSASDVRDARSLILDDFLGDFPFATETDRTHALSLLLNPFVRSMIDGPTPMYLIEAPSAGTGKGLLAHMLMLPALGGPPTLMPPSAQEEETRKRLMATVMSLPSAVLLDNVAESLDSPSLAAILTASTWTDRVLGSSNVRTIPITSTWIATGNNPSLSREMARRVIKIRLDAKSERPEDRKGFRHRRLNRWATEHRADLVSACLTLVQAWIASGKPLSEDVLGSYESWAELHGGLLRTIGATGFLANRTSDDNIVVSDDAAWASLTEVWWDRFRDREVSAADLYPIAMKIPEFPITGTNDAGMKIAFGRALRKLRDRIFGDRQITVGPVKHQALTYRLVRLSSTEEVPF